MDKKTFLAIVLSLMVVFTWQAFFAKQPSPKQPDSVQQGAPVEGKPASKEAAPEQAKPVYTRTILSKPAAGIEKDIKVETPLYTAIFTTRGGTLKSYKLNNYRANLASDSELIELVNVNEGMLRPLAVTFPGSTIDIPPESIYMTDSKTINITQSPSLCITSTGVQPLE